MTLNPETAAFLAKLAAGVDPNAPAPEPTPASSRAGYLGIASAGGTFASAVVMYFSSRVEYQPS